MIWLAAPITRCQTIPVLDSITTLVHVFVTSSVDYCNAIRAGSPGSITEKLQRQRLLKAAADFVTCTHKFDHGLSQPLHDDLHWLDDKRDEYKIGVRVHRCL